MRQRYSLSWRSDDRRRPSGVMQADEICFPLSFKGGGDPEVKPPRRKGRKKGGLMEEQVCIPCAHDPDRRVVARVAKLGKNSAAGPAGGFCRQDRRRPRKRFRRRSLVQKVLRAKRIRACRIACEKEPKRARHPSHQQPSSGLRQCINGRFHGAAAKCLSHCIAWRNPIRLNMRRASKSKGFALMRSFAIKPLLRSLAKRSAVANAFQPSVEKCGWPYPPWFVVIRQTFILFHVRKSISIDKLTTNSSKHSKNAWMNCRI